MSTTTTTTTPPTTSRARASTPTEGRQRGERGTPPPRRKKQQAAAGAGAGSNTGITRLLVVLDESGSMAAAASDVRGGFNAYVETLRHDGNRYRMTAIKFGTTVRPLWSDLPLSEVPPLSLENYTPLDTTALYDAVGAALDDARTRFGTPEKPYGVDKVILVIVTDGYENASRRYGKEEITARLARRQAAGNWTLVYMGADQDAWQSAQVLGLSQGNVLSYASKETTQAFRSLALSTSATTTNPATSTALFWGAPTTAAAASPSSPLTGPLGGPGSGR